MQKPGNSCPSAGEWVDKLWYIYTTDYNMAIKTNGLYSITRMGTGSDNKTIKH